MYIIYRPILNSIVGDFQVLVEIEHVFLKFRALFLKSPA